jgi:hypothetical protein
MGTDSSGGSRTVDRRTSTQLSPLTAAPLAHNVAQRIKRYSQISVDHRWPWARRRRARRYQNDGGICLHIEED